MKKSFNQSYSKREEALFAKMKSRRIQKWYNNRLSKIDSKEKIWLVVFTQPNNVKQEWKLKFWIWDSEENEIRGENILFAYIDPTEPDSTFKSGEKVDKKAISLLGNNPIECYIERLFECVVFRSNIKTHLIFNFEGTLIAQTEKLNETMHGDGMFFSTRTMHGDGMFFSKFLDKNILFSKSGDYLDLYYLDQKIGLLPKKIQLSWLSKLCPKKDDIQVLLCNNHCIINGYDKSGESGSGSVDTIWVYSIPKECTDLEFILKLGLSRSPYNIEAKETEDNLIISFQYYIKGKLEDKRMEIEIPKTILMN